MATRDWSKVDWTNNEDNNLAKGESRGEICGSLFFYQDAKISAAFMKGGRYLCLV